MANTIPTLHLEKVLQDHAQDMTGKVVAITGTTSGTGFVCAREVARKGAVVILLNRRSSRAEKALQALREQVPEGSFDWVECDLQSFASVREATKAIQSSYQVVDVLVNNAGVMALEDKATADGYDMQMQTNVLSHFLLTKDLFPLMRKSGQARIVNHSCMARLGGPLEAEYFGPNGGNLGGNGTRVENASFQGPRWVRYHQTKLANAAFTYGLKKKLEEANITNVLPLLAHPGLTLTQLQLTTTADGDLITRAQSVEDGATGSIRAVMDPAAESGYFYGPATGWKGFPDILSPEELLYDKVNVNINWESCEQAVGEFLMG